VAYITFKFDSSASIAAH